MKHSLVILHESREIFSSDGHWLYPLFELEDFLNRNNYNPKTLFLRDKIAGRAAACLIVRLGIKNCHINLLSDRAIPIFKKHNVAFTFDSKVDHVQCRTEDLISEQMDIEEAYLFLRKRAGRVQGVPLKIDNLSVDLGKKSILNRLNVKVGVGEQLIIHGANGTGKTTLLRSILGFTPLTGGSITIGGHTVGSSSWKQNRSIAGYVHQENVKSQFPVSAGEVVSIGLSGSRLSKWETDYRVEVAMRRTGCFHLLSHSFHSLSGGEKQRVSLARCLLQNARIFLFDEPTSFLDLDGKMALLELLTELTQKEAPTMLLVSHETSWLEGLGWKSKELKEGRLC